MSMLDAENKTRDEKIRVILASNSPRRKEILESLGVEFSVITSGVDESSDEKDPKSLAEELARIKGMAVYKEQGEPLDALIISADTVVACDGEILGKPHDRDDAKRMLCLLSGKKHSVISGISVIYNGVQVSSYSETKVSFDALNDADTEKYLDTDEPYDKAGAYAIQGYASRFISGIEGDYFTVVGLPVYRMLKLIKENFGIEL